MRGAAARARTADERGLNDRAARVAANPFLRRSRCVRARRCVPFRIPFPVISIRVPAPVAGAFVFSFSLSFPNALVAQNQNPQAQNPAAQNPAAQDPAAQDPAADARQRSLEEARRDLPKNDVGPMSIQQQVQQQAQVQQQGQQPINTNTGLRPQGPLPVSTGVNAAGTFRLIDLSLDVISSVGTSTAQNDVIQQLQGGHHDPKQRGFTMQQAELALAGAVDPYFRVDSHITSVIDPAGETIVELEEAYLTSTQFPYGLQLKAGHYLTEFGRINPVHLHDWDWGDQPVVVSRFFGGDGLRAPGARVSWIAPTETYTEVIFGAQNASGETTKSFLANEEVFEEEGVGGRFFTERTVRSLQDVIFTARASQSRMLSDTQTFNYGISALFGPNATGEDSDTVIYGADFVYLWRPASTDKGWPFFKVQGEVLARAFDAADQVDENDPLNGGDDVVVPGQTLKDYGAFLQALYGFQRGWSTGLRGEYATGSGASYDADTDTFSRLADYDRTDRLRVSPILVYQPSEFTRIRLQYNYDESDHLGEAGEHSVWLTFQTLIGVHQPHRM